MSHLIADSATKNQEGLPDYWGIETGECLSGYLRSPTNQEGLPDYWGIETSPTGRPASHLLFSYQEGLPDYWGIETI